MRSEVVVARSKADPVVLSVDNEAIYSVAEWQHVCPPNGGDTQLKDGYSAKGPAAPSSARI